MQYTKINGRGGIVIMNKIYLTEHYKIMCTFVGSSLLDRGTGVSTLGVAWDMGALLHSGPA